MSDAQDGVTKVAELVKDARISMFTTMTAHGQHVARPMALQSVEFDGDLWFFTYADSEKAGQIASEPEVNVSFANTGNDAWTSVSGRAEIVRDEAKMKELYSPALKVWFPDGLDTPGIALIKVKANRAHYWETSSSKVVQLIGAVRAAVTGNPDAFPGGDAEVKL